MLPAEILFIERGWFNANHVVLLGGDAPVLIDSGHLLGVDETLARLMDHGVDPASIGQLLNTHGHSDHIGGNARIKALSGCPIGCGPLTAKWLQTNDRHNLWLESMGQVTEIVPPDFVIEPETRVTLGGMSFEVIALPGHGPDTIGFYQPDTKVMICADALWKNDLGILNVQIHGPQVLDDAQAAVDRLSTLEIDIALPGHGGLITDVAGSLAAVNQRLEGFRRDPSQLAWHLVRRIFMFNLLRYQPIARVDLETTLLRFPWLHENTPLCGKKPSGGQWDAASMFNTLVDRFLERGLAREDEAGNLWSNVQK